jgi:hypothetical protein
MKKTLGGDRLGSGAKMQVELHGYERSTHDLGYLWRSTMAAGTLVPFLSEVALPGDTFDIHLNCDIKTHPTIGPLFGSYKVQLDVFIAPIRLYQGLLHNNKIGIGMNMAQVKLPQLELLAEVFDPTDVPDLDNSQINPSCVLSYLGIRGVAMNEITHANLKRQFNALPLLAYWDIYKNYYSNKQEELGAVIHTPSTALVNTPTLVEIQPVALAAYVTVQPKGTAGAPVNWTNTGKIRITYSGLAPSLDQIMLDLSDGSRVTVASMVFNAIAGAGVINANYNFAKGNINVQDWQMLQAWELVQQPPKVETFPLSNIDRMRELILNDTGSANAYIINNATDGGGDPLTPYVWPLQKTGVAANMLSTQEGLAIKTYQSDLFNNWLQTDWIDGAGGITEVTAIDTTGGSFTLDTLNLSKKVYDMLNRIAVSGGTYDDWLDAVYTHDRFTRVETPVYVGGLIKELVFGEVISNSSQVDQPLGTLAGKGTMANKHKGGKIIARIDEPSYIIGIISLTPRLDYSQGNKWDTHLLTMDDLHKPALDEIGFQELITEQMAWWSTHMDAGTGEWITKSAGKQPAWINYMTNVNQTRGNFAITTNEMFMTLNRRYEETGFTPNLQIKDMTTYIDPTKFNNIFAQTSLDAQNFWTQISVDITARRKMSAKIMPNL